MGKTKTFVDANVLIAAFQGQDTYWQRAMEIIDDPDRDFIVSDYLKLEVIPQPTYHRRQEEIEFMEEFFQAAAFQALPSPDITTQALELACRYGLHPLDALHAGTAVVWQADELVTLEKPDKPLGRVKEIKVVSLRNA